MSEKSCYIIPEDCKDHNSVKFRCHSSHKRPKPCPCPPKPCPPCPCPPCPYPPCPYPPWPCPPGPCSPCPCPPGGVDPEELQGPAFTETAGFAANTDGSEISVIVAGTLVSLPDEQILDGITADVSNTVFTVPEDGRYYISYGVNLEGGLVLGTRILINSVANLASQIGPILEMANFHSSIIVSLSAGNTISLQLFGLDGDATLQEGAGATLAIIRLNDGV